MTHVVNAHGHFDRELASADLQKAGVEGFTKTLFPAGEPIEVSDEVAKALTENEGLFGKFTIVDAPAAAEEAAKGEEAKVDANAPTNDSGSKQESTGTRSAKSNGSSTP